MKSKYHPWKRGFSEFKNCHRFNRLLRGSLASKPLSTLPVQLQNSYYVTTDKGMFFLEGGRVTKILEAHLYGIAFSETSYYLSAYFGKVSTVVRGNLEDLRKARAGVSIEEIYTTDVASTNSRIHQIFFSNGTLYIADSGRNTILEYDETSGELTNETAPFFDLFGSPVHYDNNHINSVAAYHDYVVFCAYRAGSGSLIGVIKDGKVAGFHYKNAGVHDIFVSDQDFFFGDTFGKGLPDRGGALIHSGGLYSDVFSRSPGWVVRGIAGSLDGELLVGHSHKGERRKRFKGNGALLVFEKGEFKQELVMPDWAQTYQIMQADGVFVRCTDGKGPLGYDALIQKLRTLLGEPVCEHDVLIIPKK